MPARPLKILLLLLLLSSAVALGVCAQAQAATTVVKVVDGNTVKVRENAKTRSVDLLGLDVPACHAAQAKGTLRKLLPAKTPVRLVKDGARRGRYVYRGATFINAALLRSGAARGKNLASLKQARALTDAETQARSAKRGLWTACAPAPPAPTPQPAEPAPPATEQARKDLAGRVFTRIATTSFSSTESRLHFCSDGRFVEDVETYSDFGGSTYGRYEGRWEVLAAEYRADYAAARVRRLNADGSEGFVDLVALGGAVTINGNSVSVQASAICT